MLMTLTVRDADGRSPGLYFRASATYYSAWLDPGACRRLVDALTGRGVRAEGVARRDLGIVTVAYAIDARTAEDALRDAQALLAVAAAEAGLGDSPHALGVVRVAR